jgi:hypothetical protein
MTYAKLLLSRPLPLPESLAALRFMRQCQPEMIAAPGALGMSYLPLLGGLV